MVSCEISSIWDDTRTQHSPIIACRVHAKQFSPLTYSNSRGGHGIRFAYSCCHSVVCVSNAYHEKSMTFIVLIQKSAVRPRCYSRRQIDWLQTTVSGKFRPNNWRFKGARSRGGAWVCANPRNSFSTHRGPTLPAAPGVRCAVAWGWVPPLVQSVSLCQGAC